MRLIHAIACASVGLVACQVAQAQVAVTRWSNKVHAWTFKVVVDNGAVLGYLGWIDPGATVGSNLEVVWYERGTQNDWSAWAWTGGTRDQAIAFVRSHFGLPTLWATDADFYPVIDLDEPEPVDAVLPTAVVDGVPINDPIAEVMAAQPNKVEFAALLTTLGWPVAPLMAQLEAASSDTANPCNEAVPTIVGLLNTMTHDVESTFGLAATTEACESWCRCHVPPPTYGAWSGWTLVPSTPTAPNPVTTPNGVTRCKWEATRTVTYHPGTGWTPFYCDECGPADPPTTQTANATTRSTTGACNPPSAPPPP